MGHFCSSHNSRTTIYIHKRNDQQCLDFARKKENREMKKEIYKRVTYTSLIQKIITKS